MEEPTPLPEQAEEEIVKLATAEKWAEILGVCIRSIQTRLRDAGITGITGRNMNGRLLPQGFYLEEDVRKACADLLNPELPETGILEFNGVQTIGECKYARYREISPETLYRAIIAAGLKPVGKARSGVQKVDLYDKCQVDALPCFSPELPETGILEFNGVQTIGVSTYASVRGIGRLTLSRAITVAGLKTIGKAKISKFTIDLYEKSEVDDLSCFSFYSELLETGILEFNGIQAIGTQKYAMHRGVSPGTLHRAILTAGLNPLGKARSGNGTIDLYDKYQVDALITANAHRWKHLKNPEHLSDSQKPNGESEE